MNMPWHPGLQSGWRFLPDSEDPRFTVTMQIVVKDAGRLWRMAAARALAFGDMTGEEVEEMLGPAEDPSLGDCIAMLMGPGDVPGCGFEHLQVVALDHPAHAGEEC